MKPGMKVPRPDIEAVDTGAFCYERSEGQQFYETPKTYELWQETPDLWFLRKWRKMNVVCLVIDGVFHVQ